EGGRALLYVDRHLVHEVTSPQAFDGLRLAGRRVRRPDLTFAVLDHNVPTYDRSLPVRMPDSALQIATLERNCHEFGLTLFDMADPRQGIVHVTAPEQGLTVPGTTVVCGDSHTSTHGAFGTLAFGIGTSEVEHVLATQTLLQARPKTMEVRVEGTLRPGSTAKDLMLAIIGTIGTGGGTGHVIEYTGAAIRSLTMEGRMTLCNMSIVVGVTGCVPDPSQFADPGARSAVERALTYMDLQPGTPITDIRIDRVFIGSCTNARIEDLRAAARILAGRRVAPTVKAMVVPGS